MSERGDILLHGRGDSVAVREEGAVSGGAVVPPWAMCRSR